MASNGKIDHYHKEAPESKDGDVAGVQMDFMFVGAEGIFVDEQRAKATVLMVVCEDDGNLSATEVRTKTDEYGVLSTYKDVEIKTDGGPSICRDCSEGTISTGQDNDYGTDKCWRTSRDWSSGTCEWNGSGSVACVLSGRAGASHSLHSFSHGCCGIQCGRWCATKPIRGRNRLRMRGQEAVDTSHRLCHLE